MRFISISPAGSFSLSLTAAGISPVSTRAMIFSSSVLPTPGSCGDRSVLRHLLDRAAFVPDGPRRVHVGQHPVPVGSVELVEHGELFEGGGDLGVGHGLT